MTKKADTVVEYVRGRVFSGAMVPGEWYSVIQLAEELSISRSPVREALLRLEEAGLVRFTKNRGFQVNRTGPADVAGIFAVRMGIEPAAAYRAAKWRTEEQLLLMDAHVSSMYDLAQTGEEDAFFTHDRALHNLVMEMGNAHRGAEVVDRLRASTRVLGYSTAGRSRTLPDILAEHQPIVEAIRSGNSPTARDAMREHLTSTGMLLLRQAWATQPAGDNTGSDDAIHAFWQKHIEGF